MFNKESFGTPVDERKNGYFVGKFWMGVTISMWKEDRLKGDLVLWRLYEDPLLPHWWLDTVFPDTLDSQKKRPTIGMFFETLGYTKVGNTWESPLSSG